MYYFNTTITCLKPENTQRYAVQRRPPASIRLLKTLNRTMTALEKYPCLQEREFLISLISQSVYTNMALEAQDVSHNHITSAVTSLVESALQALEVFAD